MADDKMKSGEILLYNDGGDKEFVSVIFKDENFWLTQKAMAELFGCTADNISLHLKNIFADEELDKDAVTENFSVTAADVFEQCSYDYDKNSETTKAFYAFVQNKLHFAVTGKTAAELIAERATLDSPTMGLTTWKGAPDGKILKSDALIAKNYLNEKELSRLNRLVTMFIDYAELMAEDEQLMSMQDWLDETDRFLTNNRCKVLPGKGSVSHDDAVKKVSGVYDWFRKKQDADYISEFDRETAKYLKGGEPK